ncbi:MAG: hypothetical protein M3Z23_15990, partial [Acidobacteriota bacterium]|nr:hypothetical protein [Acidobacteriota bacterium]
MLFPLLLFSQIFWGQTASPGTPSLEASSRPYQRPEACLPCHQRQYDELRSAVKAGYRNVSPLMNGLELASNFLTGGLLRPVYGDSTKIAVDGTPLRSNLVSTPSFTNISQARAGFCISCHNPHLQLMGEDPKKREVPELPGTGVDFRPDLIRPLRDFHLTSSAGDQVLPSEAGGDPPPGALPSLGAAGITCDVCHNVTGPDMHRSFQHDGFGNMSLTFMPSLEKVGPFLFADLPRHGFHMGSNDPDRIAFLRSSALCNSCHDVRVPGAGSLTHEEHDINPGGEKVAYFRLENLSTEWQTGPYNSANNPFGKVVRCQDCHMSTFPFSRPSTYRVGGMEVTSPTPGIFPSDYAAVPGVSTELGQPLQKRSVVTHYLTGVDVPLMSTRNLQERLGSDYPDARQDGLDNHGLPRSIAARRIELLKAATRIGLDKTDATATTGQPFTVRATAVSLTGHRFPAGFSQERTAYIELTVKDDNGLLLYQSGYQIDKPHPETGETEPDGNLDDEDLEHVHAVVDPGLNTPSYEPGPAVNGHTNQIFELGPDSGPETRVYTGAPRGLVLFRNELTRIFLPGDELGRRDSNGRNIVLDRPHFEEVYSASFANAVDNFRSLAPLRPTTYQYEVQLPGATELEALGVRLKGPLHVHAQINFEHFPPLFLRFLARTTGPDGPAGHSLHLLDEKT